MTKLKIVVSNRNLLFQRSIFRGELLVSGRVIYLFPLFQLPFFQRNQFWTTRNPPLAILEWTDSACRWVLRSRRLVVRRRPRSHWSWPSTLRFNPINPNENQHENPLKKVDEISIGNTSSNQPCGRFSEFFVSFRKSIMNACMFFAGKSINHFVGKNRSFVLQGYLFLYRNSPQKLNHASATKQLKGSTGTTLKRSL